MAKFKNVSPLGALDVPALGRVVQEGEVFEVREELAPLFAEQTGNYEPVTAAPANAKAAAKTKAAAKPAADEADTASAEEGAQ